MAMTIKVTVTVREHQSSQSTEQNGNQYADFAGLANRHQVCATQVSSLQKRLAQSITNEFFGLSAVSIRQCAVINTVLVYICSMLVRSLHTLPSDALYTLMHLSWLSCHFAAW